VQIYLAYLFIFSGNKTWAWLCVDSVAGTNNICFLSVGQTAYGIITIGQFTVGFFNISQIGIGLIASVGQVSASCGFSIGQVTHAFYVYGGMFCIAFYKVNCALFGFHCVYAIWQKQPFVACGCADKKGAAADTGVKKGTLSIFGRPQDPEVQLMSVQLKQQQLELQVQALQTQIENRKREEKDAREINS